MGCPNRNTNEYKELARVVGDVKAHEIWAKNGDNGIRFNSDGTVSESFKRLEELHGTSKAIEMRSRMFGDEFTKKYGEWYQDGKDIKLNEEGYFEFNGMKFTTSNVPKVTNEVMMAKKRGEFIDSSRHIENLFSVMKSSVPGLNIVPESFRSLAGTKHQGEHAWSDADGLHFNTQAFHIEAPIHELSHVWTRVMKEVNPTKYEMFLQRVRESIPENQELFNMVRKNYPDLNDIDLMHEYASQLAGITSVKQLQNKLFNNNVAIDSKRAGGLLSTIRNVVGDFYDSLKESFLGRLFRNKIDINGSELNKIDFNKASLKDIFTALTNDVMNGKNIVGIGPRELNKLVKGFYQDDFYEAKKNMDNDKEMINDISHLTAHLLNTDQASVYSERAYENPEYRQKTIEKLSNSILKDYTNGSSFIYDMGKRYDLGVDPSKETKIKILNDLIDRRQQFISSFNDNVHTIIQQWKLDQNRDIREHIKEVFGDYKLSEQNIDDIKDSMVHMGINEKIVRIMRYSELKNDTEMSHLYNDMLHGYNPTILVHDISYDKNNKKVFDISIVDLATGLLGRNEANLSSHELNLGAALGVTSKDQLSMSNYKSDIRKVLVGMTIAGMNKLAMDNGGVLKIRKSGLIGFNGMTMRPHMIGSLQEVFENARGTRKVDGTIMKTGLLMMPEIQTLIDKSNPNAAWFMEMINDDKAWDSSSIHQSWKNRLESWYVDNQTRLGWDSSKIQEMKEVFGTDRERQFFKERQLELQNKMKGSKSRSEWEPRVLDSYEDKMLSMYLMNTAGSNLTINNRTLKDIDPTFRKITTIHDISNPAIQYFSIEAEAAKALIIDRLNEHKETFSKLLDESLKSHGKTGNGQNLSESIFGHLFRKFTFTMEDNYGKDFVKGMSYEGTLFNRIHGSYDLEGAKKAGLTDADIALCDYIIENVKQRLIDNAIHKNKYNRNFNLEEKVQEISARIGNGWMPVLPMTRSELVRKGKVKDFWEKTKEKNAIGEYMPGDVFEKYYGEMNSMFERQIDETAQLKQMGVYKEGSLENPSDSDIFVMSNKKDYDNHTHNIEYLFNMFMHDGIRMEEIENRVIPAYNQARQWMDVAENEYSVQQKYSKEFLQEYYDRVVLRKNQDTKTNYSSFIRNALNMYSFVALGYRPEVWFRSGYFNTQNHLMESLANSAVNMKSVMNDNLDMPGVSDVSKAHSLLFSDYAKMYALAKKFSIINSSEMEAIESVFTTKAEHHPLRQQYAQIGNYYTDIASRMVTMAAYMVRDGSWDAHVYDEHTNTIKWEPTKDARIADKDGNITEKGKYLLEDIKRSQIDQGMKNNQMVGYDYKEANTRFKWYSDKFIIGSMDEYQKSLLGNTATGALFTQFRNYLPDKLFNYFGSTRMVQYGNGRSVEFENEIATVLRKEMQIEGAAYSFMGYFKDVAAVLRTKDWTMDDISKVWSDSDPMRRRMIYKSMIQAAMFTGICASLYMMSPWLNDYQKQKLQWTYAELQPLSWYDETKSNIIPVTSLIDTAWGIMTGSAGWTKLLKYAGPAYDVVDIMELLSGENLRQQWNPKHKKVADMNDEELQDFREKQAIEKAKKEKKNQNS